MANQRDSSEAVLSDGSAVRGRITGEGNVRIQGSVEGDVSIQGTVTVAEGGVVHGDVLEAREVIIAGELISDTISADGVVTMLASAVVRGVVRSRAVHIHEGATLSVEMDSDFELPEELR